MAVGTRGPVSVRAIYALAVAISGSADGATGRNALPGNAALTVTARDIGGVEATDPESLARLAASSGYGLTTVQKAVSVLVRRGWLVLMRAGKNRLGANDRLELWEAGSKARRRRNVWACSLPAHLRRQSRPSAACPDRTPASPTVDNLGGPAPSTDSGCDLPTARRVVWVPPGDLDNNFRPGQARRTGAARQPPTSNEHTSAGPPGRPPGHRYRADARVVQLASDLKTRIPWLRTVPHQRIMAPLHRFAVTGWTARTLQTHLDRLLKQRGWTVPGRPAETVHVRFGTTVHRPASTMRSPWGYLAFLLRRLDPSDLAVEQAHTAELAAREHYQRQLIHGTPCPHGQPAGNTPSPARGVLACALCRRERVGMRSA